MKAFIALTETHGKQPIVVAVDKILFMRPRGEGGCQTVLFLAGVGADGDTVRLVVEHTMEHVLKEVGS
jgi:hypothetical protein